MNDKGRYHTQSNDGGAKSVDANRQSRRSGRFNSERDIPARVFVAGIMERASVCAPLSPHKESPKHLQTRWYLWR
jgi:hypothetical protein